MVTDVLGCCWLGTFQTDSILVAAARFCADCYWDAGPGLQIAISSCPVIETKSCRTFLIAFGLQALEIYRLRRDIIWDLPLCFALVV